MTSLNSRSELLAFVADHLRRNRISENQFNRDAGTCRNTWYRVRKGPRRDVQFTTVLAAVHAAGYRLVAVKEEEMEAPATRTVELTRHEADVLEMLLQRRPGEWGAWVGVCLESLKGAGYVSRDMPYLVTEAGRAALDAYRAENGNAPKT